MPPVPTCRSALFLPASNPRAIEKARTLAADAVILDLEDAVAPDRKGDARDAARQAILDGGFTARWLVVRTNAACTGWAIADLAMLAEPAVAARIGAVLLPKVDDVATLQTTRAALGPDGPPFWAMIETARGLMALPNIASAAASMRLEALVAGTNDLALDLRCRPGPDRAPLLPALASIVAAARAGGLIALDGVLNAIDDPAALDIECRQGADWGFDGKSLIHPSQIDIANRAFGPSGTQLDWARRIVDAFADASTATRGAIRVDGQMVERLHLTEAERLLSLAG